MKEKTTLFRARVPKDRLRRAEKVLAKMGLKPGEAFNLFLAQVELREALPFAVTANPGKLLTSDEQATAWTQALDAY
ncbi:MAG TPA: type II toxin-antitoxin system RelB/DinJ family antitoxin [Lacipirellulaceae bacterium]|nr:type II toxin-antitoxin system RelB/DinJ family antitoxin [Lacipirellulaceae bacterium]